MHGGNPSLTRKAPDKIPRTREGGIAFLRRLFPTPLRIKIFFKKIRHILAFFSHLVYNSNYNDERKCKNASEKEMSRLVKAARRACLPLSE